MAASVPAALDRFPEVWAVDFEYIAKPGERPAPICCVGLELRSGREIRLWGDELRQPLPIGSKAVFVAFYAPAEMTSYLALGWPLPAYVIDLFAEFRTFTNGRDSSFRIPGASLLAALAYFGLSHLDPETKTRWRDRILAGPPYGDAERDGILDYCASDVMALRHLLPALTERLARRPHWLEHALLRGRYMRAVARMEHIGTPIDMLVLSGLAEHWDEIKSALVDQVRSDYPIFDGTTLKMDRFERWLAEQGIPWPRTQTGRLSLSEDTFKSMTKVHPIVAPIREVRDNLAKLRLSDLGIGADGRNRAMLSPFRARSGRNQPSASKFIFGPSVWLRSLIRPAPGCALAYIDYSSQEIAVAAALSGDEAMQRAYRSGDPYVAFAIDAGLAPPGATKATHEPMRNRCKAVVLGILYGMQEHTLAESIGVPVAEARALLRAHRRAYAVFWDWSQRVIDTAMLQGYLDTCFGWRLHVTSQTRPTSLLNHPMQAHGAEMLRLACCFLTEAGITVCAPVHDAVLIESADEGIDQAVALARELMGRASRIVLPGFEVRTDAELMRYPQRYMDPRGNDMWERVMRIRKTIDGQAIAMAA